MIEQLKACVNIATSENEFRTQLLAYIDCMSDFGKLVDELTEENEELKAQIEQLSNDNHVLKTSFITQQEQIEKMKNCPNCKNRYPETKEDYIFCAECSKLDETKDNIILTKWELAE